MTVAAAFEIRTGATPTPSLGKTPGAVHSAGRTGAAVPSLLSSTVPTATSFRAGWQSLLATLNSNMAVTGEADADQGAASAGPATRQILEKSSALTQANGIRLLQGQGTEKGSAETGAGAMLSPAVVRIGAVVTKPAAVAAKPASTRTVEKDSVAKPGTESIRNSHSARSTNTTKTDSVSAEPMPAVLPAATVSLSQAAPAAAVVSPVAQSTDVRTQLAQTEISADLSTDQPAAVASASLDTHAADRGTPRYYAEASNPAVKQIAVVPETPALQRQASPVSNLSGSSGSTLSETESAVADKAAPPPVAMLAEGGDTTETPAPVRSLPEQTIQAATWNASPAEASATSQESSPTFARDYQPTQAFAPSTNLTETLATSPASSPALAPEQSQMQTFPVSQSLISEAAPGHHSPSTFNPDQTRARAFVHSQNPSQAAETSLNSSEISAKSPASSSAFVSFPSRTQAFVPSHNPITAHAASQILTQTTAPSTNPAETLAISQATSPTLVSNQHQTPTYVQSREQVAIQQGNEGVNVVAAPIPGDGLNPLPVTAIAAAQSGQLSDQPPALSKPGSSSSGKTLTSESVRGAGNSVQQVSRPMDGQSYVPAVDASALARALAGTGGTVSTSGERAGASSIAATQPDSREAFATLDTSGTPVATTWIHAGTQRAEAGYQDPALGWVSVRADLSGGVVHAQLVPGSADAAQALGSHLTGLNAYLDEHHTPVETLTLTAPEGGWSGLGSGQGTGEGMQQGAGQQTAQGADASTQSGQYSEPVIQPPAASAELPAFFGDMNGSTQPTNLDGYHISVMA